MTMCNGAPRNYGHMVFETTPECFLCLLWRKETQCTRTHDRSLKRDRKLYEGATEQLEFGHAVEAAHAAQHGADNRRKTHATQAQTIVDEIFSMLEAVLLREQKKGAKTDDDGDLKGLKRKRAKNTAVADERASLTRSETTSIEPMKKQPKSTTHEANNGVETTKKSPATTPPCSSPGALQSPCSRFLSADSPNNMAPSVWPRESMLSDQERDAVAKLVPTTHQGPHCELYLPVPSLPRQHPRAVGVPRVRAKGPAPDSNALPMCLPSP